MQLTMGKAEKMTSGRTQRQVLLRWAPGFILACACLAGCGSKARPECATEVAPSEGEAGITDLVIAATASPLDTDQVQILWEAGPHAHSQVFENATQDVSCARCHAPESWTPAAREVPASWSQAGVSLASLTASAQPVWSPVGCAVCHSGDPETIEGEIAWLDVPSALLYSAVETSTELCQKCHLAGEVEDHLSIVVSGSHQEMSCTDCHAPHDTTASCTGSGCHEVFAAECEPIETHDKPHKEASCAACHDADGLAIDWNESDQVWDTVVPSSMEGEYRTYASHALILEVACERCHEPGNHPWGDSKE